MWRKNKQPASFSFRVKIFVSSFICIGVPVLIILSVYNYMTKDTVKEQAIQNAGRELALTEEYVTKLFSDMLNVANFVQLDAKMNAVLKSRANESGVTDPEINYDRFLDDRTVMKTLENITLVGEKSFVTILLKNGQFYTNYPVSDYNPADILEETWFEKLEVAEGYDSIWIGSQPTIFESEKMISPYQISVGRTLRDQSADIYGYVVVTVLENRINQIFEQGTGQEEIMLVNAEDTVISHRDSDRIGKLFPYRDIVEAEQEQQVVSIENHDYLFTERQLSFNDWKLVSLVPYREAVSRLNSIFRHIFLVLAISFAVFFVLLAYLINRITKPLVELGSVVTLVQEGKLNVRSRIDSNDEIGRFSKSFDAMLDKINSMIKEVTETQSRKRKAELAMLQTQINPHFLFNVLNSIRMKVLREGSRDSAAMISSLSKLLRMTIGTDKGAIKFKEEVEIAQNYVNLMNMRQKEKAEFIICVTDEAGEKCVPRFILQPVIENSIIHGLNQNGGTIVLESYLESGSFVIRLKDNGQGMKREALLQLRHKITGSSSMDPEEAENKKGMSGIGLPNVYERMKMTYGSEFYLSIESKENEGTSVIFSIPAEEGGGAISV